MLDKQNQQNQTPRPVPPLCPNCQSYNTKPLGTGCQNCGDAESVPDNYFCHGCQAVFYFKSFIENKMDHRGKENKSGTQTGRWTGDGQPVGGP